MKDNNKTANPQLLRFRSTFEHSKLARWTCIVFPMVVILALFFNHQSRPYYTYDLTTQEERCWLKEAFMRGDFMIGSHRSLGDSHYGDKQPSCLEGLMELSVSGIHYLDLDLIWDPNQNQLVVAHPMEFEGTTDFYSPCAKTPLVELMRLVKTAMPKWFLSLEPKADWDYTQEYPTLKEPVLLLSETLKVMELMNPQPSQCTLYVDVNKVQRKEEYFLDKLATYCTLSFAIRRFEGHDAQRAVAPNQQAQAQQQQQEGNTEQAKDQPHTHNYHYEYIMPTIEFHPTHPNHAATTGVESLQLVQQTVPKSIYWVVDTTEDLERVAMFKATGLVSNRPLEMVKILKDPRYGWCPVSSSSSSLKKSAVAMSD